MIWLRRAFYDTANALVILDDSPQFCLEDVNFKGERSQLNRGIPALRLLGSRRPVLTDLCSGVA
jgi:hypothetical protein